jgi:hypothetical protein
MNAAGYPIARAMLSMGDSELRQDQMLPILAIRIKNPAASSGILGGY